MRISKLFPIMEAAHEYHDMLRHIPVELKGGKAVTLWDISNAILANKPQSSSRYSNPVNPRRNSIQTITDEIRKTFQRRDRVVWAMRYFKYWAAYELRLMVAASRRIAPNDFFTLNFGAPPKARQPALTEIVNRLSWLPEIDYENSQWDWEFPNGRVSAFYAAVNLCAKFSHLMEFANSQYEGNPMQRYDFGRSSPSKVFADLEAMEIEIKASAGVNAVSESGKIVIRFPDKSAWWNLECAYSPEEARSMGHCGNQGARGDKAQSILSYRTLVKLKGQSGGAVKWLPHLTFILHNGSTLGEMKGRANNKPDPKYHPYIVEILKQPFIKKVHGGGYRPHANFCLFKSDGMSGALNGWTDLSPELASSLHDVKPEIYHSGDFCNYCYNNMPKGFEFDEKTGGSMPMCMKFRKIKRIRTSLDSQMDQIGGEVDGLATDLP